MKKISRTIAVIVLMVMAAGSFTGCFTAALMSGGGSGGELILFTIPLDIVTLPIQLIYWIVTAAQDAARKKRGEKMDGIDTFSAVVSSLPETELFSLKEKINSLPEAKVDSLMNTYNSLTEGQIDPYIKTVNSYSEKEITAMITAFNNLSDTEIVSSIETFNSMPEEMLVAALNALQKTRFRYQY